MTVETRFAVNVSPKAGILDPQGRAVEGSLDHLAISGVSGVRVGRRIELTVAASDDRAARATVERLASELLSNPLIEAFDIEVLGAAPSLDSRPVPDPDPAARATADAAPAGPLTSEPAVLATPEGAST